MQAYHGLVVKLAVAGACFLLVGMLLGFNVSLKDIIGVDRSLRDICVALWAFLLPAWFTIEDTWFKPDPANVEEATRYLEGQRKARITWTLAAGAIAVVIGATAPAPLPNGNNPNKQVIAPNQ